MTKPVTQKVADEVEEVYEDLVHSLRKAMKHLAADAGDEFSARGVQLAHAAMDLVDEVKAETQSLAKKAGKEVREHPATSAAIAAAAVALLGVAISRRMQPRD